ncbi:MAG TPA: 30S ribosomal protein S12 methylthiotransferase RimO [Gammaproteobacteria bacterium]|nr:30S ribosomal protein S12 methylthiotransferase RimO [Gammaproteobacteria bacterium]MEC8011383.1 30S ribosomal protein S12 methylthiotransferase RimO [Pseudomonadota bacterium]HBF08562.1 30S ribosomal protein S12 methylthiotransferase RimO [Gammaproteobacteria bacterium]HCK92050.1 30S ribosomal protein S12 methylthiotransferase RimO [Gammaproteobacteria bacterium]|tara:strand:+ start:5007 stop:6383 length:1377 start_codon:yes stop_codon:yes gene_type:complete
MTTQTPSKTTKAPAVGFISLGCPKALVDSERILTQLRTEGYQVVPSYEGADLVIVNTCGFIDDAKAESLQTIGEALEANGKVLVTGCMGAKPSEISEIHPKVLGITGPAAYEAVMGQVHEHLPYKAAHDPKIDLVPPQGVKLTPKHYAYLKISEGCNHSCSFCIIPSMRGKLVSRPAPSVLDEAERLVNSGVKELLVVSQDTSAYGIDTKYALNLWQGRPVKTRFQDLCEALGHFDAWVRLHYVYPYPHVKDVIPLMAEGKILPYLDIPFQHASHSVLKLMKRPAHAENTIKRIKEWREICPDLTIRSTFIVGFPGETDDDFEMLLDYLDEAQIDRAGCFKYSPVEGADANHLEGHVPEEVKEERYARFMERQQQVSYNRLQRKVNTVQDVILDGQTEAEDGSLIWVARTKGDAPEIDGNMFIDIDGNPLSSKDWRPGQIVQAKVVEADEYDLFGVPV